MLFKNLKHEPLKNLKIYEESILPSKKPDNDENREVDYVGLFIVKKEPKDEPSTIASVASTGWRKA